MAERETERVYGKTIMRRIFFRGDCQSTQKTSAKKVARRKDATVSHEAIYRYIYDGDGRYGSLYKKLQKKQKMRQRQFDRKPKKERIPDRISIHERPVMITERRLYED